MGEFSGCTAVEIVSWGLVHVHSTFKGIVAVHKQ